MKRQPAIVLVLGVAALVAAMLTAVAATGHLVPGDHPIANAVQSVPGEGPEEIADVLALTVTETVIWIAAAFIAWRRRSAALLIAGVLVALALTANPVIKEIVDRARPAASDLTIRETDAHEGFPSGHVQGATLIYGYLWCAISLMGLRARIWVTAFVAAVLLLIAFDRVYNGAHWPSDVVGGFAYGVLLLALCVLAGRGLSGLPAWSARRRPGSVARGAAMKGG